MRKRLIEVQENQRKRRRMKNGLLERDKVKREAKERGRGDSVSN